MTAELKSHPSAAQLHSFAQGRLAPAEMAEVERHVATCDSCCQALENVPEDTLIHLAREAATAAFLAGETPPASAAAGKNSVPPELAEHTRYKILGLVGQGGMGAVYKAEHRLMERLVALKVISRSFTANPQAVERFRREVKAAAKLSHANIVTAHDAEQAGDLHFLVMEFVEGVSLDRLVAKQGVPTVPQACGLIRQAALGLQHAHEKGMVHRDIKPANLMVTRRGQIKILDFGLARLAREMASPETQAMTADAADSGNATTAGMILGTPDYIAPEQAADSRQADIRADIYSLGCTFYFLLTGQPPFPKGTVMQKLASHMHTAPASVAQRRPEIPAEVAAIVERMMRKNPADRYQTPGEVAKDLAAVQKGTAASLPKLEELKPADDLFAGLDLATVPAAPTIQLQPAAATGDISDWFIQNRRLVTMIGAIAGGVLLVALCAWGAGKLWNNSSVADAKQGTAAPLYPNATQPGRAFPAKIDDSSSEASFKGSSSNQGSAVPYSATSETKARVLFCVPSKGLYTPDYDNVVDHLPPQVAVTVASTSPDECLKYMGGKSGVTPDVVIGRDPIRAADYDAIIFGGADTTEFEGESTADLLRDFKVSGKLISAICKGQQVLLHHGYFVGDVGVAKSGYLAGRYPSSCNPRETPVVRDRNLVTARDDQAGPAFANELVRAFQQRKAGNY